MMEMRARIRVGATKYNSPKTHRGEAKKKKTGHLRLVCLCRVRVRDGSSTVARATEVERVAMRDGIWRHPLHTKR